jgi:hypothetical protein
MTPAVPFPSLALPFTVPVLAHYFTLVASPDPYSIATQQSKARHRGMEVHWSLLKGEAFDDFDSCRWQLAVKSGRLV